MYMACMGWKGAEWAGKGLNGPGKTKLGPKLPKNTVLGLRWYMMPCFQRYGVIQMIEIYIEKYFLQ
jgi:hypothetical protein